MKTPEQKFKSRVMKRVYGIWVLRYVLPRLAGSFVLFFAALRITADTFFVARIIQNFEHVASSNVWAIFPFITSALNHAEPFVLILISAAGIAGFALAVNLFRNIRSIMRNQNSVIAVPQR